MSRGIKYFIRHSMSLDLAEFLRKNKCTEKYINNTYNHLVAHCSKTKITKNYHFYVELRKIINDIYNRGWLTSILYSSFTWDQTPEGYRFWSEILDKAVTFQEQYK